PNHTSALYRRLRFSFSFGMLHPIQGQVYSVGEGSIIFVSPEGRSVIPICITSIIFTYVTTYDDAVYVSLALLPTQSLQLPYLLVVPLQILQLHQMVLVPMSQMLMQAQ
nr:hypothetical protein [Bacillus pacificus]